MTDHARSDGGSAAEPRISVIITNYNYAAYVGHAIRSVLSQTYRNVECIVVDDGSKDDSVEVIRSFDGVTLIAKANGGQVSAVIEGVARATGEVIIFLDSDDCLYSHACATVAAAFRSDIALYQYGLDIVDADGRRIGAYPDAPLLSAGQAEAAMRYGAFPSSPTSGNAFAASHVRRMLAEIGPERRYFIDGYLIYSAPFFGAVLPMRDVLGSYLVHGGNVSLSAGVTRISAEKSLRNALWQRTGIVNALRLQGRTPGIPADYLTAWYLRYLLVLRRCYGVRDIAAELSDAEVARRAIAAFAIVPRASLRQRVQNLVLILSLMAGDCRLGRRVVPEVTKPN